MCPAPRAFLREEGVRENNGMEYKVLLDDEVGKYFMLCRSAPSNLGGASPRADLFIETNEAEDERCNHPDFEDFDWCDENHIRAYNLAKWKKSYLFYSAQQFTKLIGYIKPTPDSWHQPKPHSIP